MISTFTPDGKPGPAYRVGPQGLPPRHGWPAGTRRAALGLARGLVKALGLTLSVWRASGPRWALLDTVYPKQLTPRREVRR